MLNEILSLSGDRINQEFSRADKSNSYWRAPRPSFQPPLGITVESAKNSLKEKQITPIDGPSILTKLGIVVFFIISIPFRIALINISPPMKLEYECHYHCEGKSNLSLRAGEIEPIAHYLIFYGVVSALFLLHIGVNYVKAEHAHKQAKSYNAKVNKLADHLMDKDDRNLPLSERMLLKMMNYLPAEIHSELSFAQIDAFKRRDAQRFTDLLNGCSLKPLQKSFWHLLAHIEKAKEQSIEQESILSQPSAIQLLRAEPLAYEKILRIVHQTLLVDTKLCHFYSSLLLDKLLTKQFAKAIGAHVDLPKLILSIAGSELSLLEAIDSLRTCTTCNLGNHQLSLPADAASWLMAWQDRCDRKLIQRLTKDEIELFVASLEKPLRPKTISERYSLLRALKAFKQTKLGVPLENKIAKQIGELISLFTETEELLEEVRFFEFDLLERTIDEHLSLSFSEWDLEAILSIYEKYANYHLHKTKIALDSALVEKFTLYATHCLDHRAFAAKLGEVKEIGAEAAINAALEKWMGLYHDQGEKLYEIALDFSFCWLQKAIVRIIQNNPTLKNYWLNPPIEA
jgi:hypothetical protein